MGACSTLICKRELQEFFFFLLTNTSFNIKKAISFLICCKCHTCVNMLSTATLSFTHKSLLDSVTSICIKFIWMDLRGPPPPACSCNRRICFFISARVESLLSDLWAQNIHVKTFMSSGMNVVALCCSLIRSVPLRGRSPWEHRGQRRPGQLEKLYLLLQASQSCLSTFCCEAPRGTPTLPHPSTHPV